MAVVPARKTLSATRTRLDAESSDSLGGQTVVVFPQAAGTIIIGDETVTSATGARVLVAAGDRLSFGLDAGEKLYGILAAGTLEVDVLGLGQ